MNVAGIDIPVIAFDGGHRAGKGTQIDILQKKLGRMGFSSIALRGDGSREGQGSHPGDPYSVWWQRFKKEVEQSEDEYEVWRMAARRLIGEAACHALTVARNSELGNKQIIIVDRSTISRAQMTLKEGVYLNDETMYWGKKSPEDCLPVFSADVTVYMHASPNVLCARLRPDDPKRTFREKNIISSADTYRMAYEHLVSIGRNVVKVDASQSVRDVASQVDDAIMDTLKFTRGVA